MLLSCTNFEKWTLKHSAYIGWIIFAHTLCKYKRWTTKKKKYTSGKYFLSLGPNRYHLNILSAKIFILTT